MLQQMISTMRIKALKKTTSAAAMTVVAEDDTKVRAGLQLLAEYGIVPEAELSETQWNAFLEDARRWSAKERAIRIVAATNISKKKLGRRLVEKGESQADADAAVAWLDEMRLLDDRMTGESLVRGAVSKGYGIHRIRQLLREKEIPQEYWQELLEDLPPMGDAIDRLLQKKLKGKDADKKEVQRAVDALLRYGHSWEDIRAGLERFHADADLEEPQ